MKNKLYFLLGLLSLFMIISCNFQIPQKITVKTSPTVKASAGTVDLKVEDFITVEKIKDMVSKTEVEGLNVMEYKNSNTEAMTFLVHYPLEKVSFDISEQISQIQSSLENMNFTLDSESSSTSFQIPDINQSFDQTTTVELSASVIEEINNGMKPISLSYYDEGSGINIGFIPETGRTDYYSQTFGGLEDEISHIKFSMENDEDEALAEKIIFGENSKIIITFDQIVSNNPESANPYTVEITSFGLRDAEGNVIVQNTSISTELTDENPQIVLDMSNITLPTVSYIFFGIRTKGGDPTPEPLHTTTARVSISETTTIKEVTGFSLKEEDGETDTIINYAIPTQTIDLSSFDGIDMFKEAEIEDGNITINFDLPDVENWNGINAFLNLSVEQENGLNVTQTNVNLITTKTLTIPLNNQIINTNSITISGNAQFSVTNPGEDGNPSKITFEELGKIAIGIVGNVDINKFSTATVKIPSEYISKLQQTQEIEVPADLKTWVKEIAFDELSVEFEIDTTLPINNEIGLNVTSTAFDLDDTFSLCRTDESITTLVDKIEKTNFTILPRELGDYFDFSIGITLPNQTEVDGETYTTISNITSGENISFQVKKITPVINWNKIIVSPDGEMGSFSGMYPLETDENGEAVSGIDISVLGDYLKNLEFNEVSALIYLSSPLFEEIMSRTEESGLSGKVWATYKTDEEDLEGQTTYFMGSAEDEALVNFVETPVIDQNTTIYTEALPNPSAKVNFASILNAHPMDLRLNYDFALDEITILPEDLETLSENAAELKVDIILLLPLELNIAEGMSNAEIDLSQFIYPSESEESEENSGEGTEETVKDLLGRTEPIEIDEITEFLKDFSVSLEFDYENNLGIACSVVMEDTAANSKIPKKEFSIRKTASSEKIKLTKEEMEYVLKTYPFAPDLKLLITDDIKIPSFDKSPSIKMTVKMAVYADVDYTLDLTGNGEE